MEYSLPAWLGALAGAIVAVALYAPAIRYLDRYMRAEHEPASAEEREAFEDRLSIARRVILGIDIAILATVGYWIGKAIGGGGAPPLIR
jgi:hypothetical protein